MEPITAILLVVGCSGNLDACKELPAPAPIYQSADDCQADRITSKAKFQMEGDYKRIFATCFAIDPSIAEGDAAITWNVDATGKLTAAVEPDPGYEIANDLAKPTLVSSAE